MPFSNITAFKLLQLIKAKEPILVSVFGKIHVPVRPLQFWNAVLPMVVTLGNDNAVIPVQLKNAACPIIVASGKVCTPVKPVQLLNAQSLSTVALGKENPVNPVQVLNALSLRIVASGSDNVPVKPEQ